MSFQLTSSAFSAGSAIPATYSCKGKDISPPLAWSQPPAGTQSLALIMDDPDAPDGTWVHWVLFNIPSDRKDLPQNIARSETVAGIGVQGKNSGGKHQYQGPCPPFGKAHRYIFTLYAVDERLFLPPGTGKPELEAALKGHVLGKTSMSGVYQRVQPEVSCCSE